MHKKILLIGMPYWAVAFPFPSLVYVSGIIKTAGWDCKIADLNIEFYRTVLESEQKYWNIHNPLYKEDDATISQESLYHKYKNQIENLLIQYYEADNYDFVVFTVNLCTRYLTVEATKFLKAKYPDIKIMYGGIDCFPTEYNTGFFEDNIGVDIICQGEAEIALPQFLKDFEKKRSINTDVKGFIYKSDGKLINTGEPDLPSLTRDVAPYDWTQTDFSLYTQPGDFLLFTSRGCTNKCKFCSECNNFKKYRFRKAEDIFKEIQNALVYAQKYSKKPTIHIGDSLINGNIKELEKLCDLIIESEIQIHIGGIARFRKEMTYQLLEKMKRAGFFGFFWGFESGSQKIVDLMGKNFDLNTATEIIKTTHKLGMINYLPIIIGFPGENSKDFVETVSYIIKHRKYAVFLSPSTMHILSNSYIYNFFEEYGLVRKNDEDWFTKDNKNNIQIRLFRRFIANNAVYNDDFSLENIAALNIIESLDFNDLSLASEIAAILYELALKCSQTEKIKTFLSNWKGSPLENFISTEEMTKWNPQNMLCGIELENWFLNDKNSEFQRNKINKIILELLSRIKISNMINALNNSDIKNNVINFISNNKDKKICFYGAGKIAKQILETIDLSELNIIGFIDKNPEKKGQKIGNYNIYSVQDLQNLKPDVLILSVLEKLYVLPYLEAIKEAKNLNFEIIEDLFSYKTDSVIKGELFSLNNIKKSNPEFMNGFICKESFWQNLNNQEINLHLGCGNNIIENFINIDYAFESPEVLKWNLLDIWPQDIKNKVNTVFSEDVFEHFFYNEQLYILCSINTALKPDGVCRILMPNIDKLIKHSFNMFSCDNNEVKEDSRFFYDMGVRTKTDSLNMGLFFSGHRWLHGPESFTYMSKLCGFKVFPTSCTESTLPFLSNLNIRTENTSISFANDLIVENKLRKIIIKPKQVKNAVFIENIDKNQDLYMAENDDPQIIYEFPESINSKHIVLINMRGVNISQFSGNFFAAVYFKPDENYALYLDNSIKSCLYSNIISNTMIESKLNNDTINGLRFDPSQKAGDYFTAAPLEAFLKIY